MLKWKRPRVILGFILCTGSLLIIISVRQTSRNTATRVPQQIHERKQPEKERDFIDNILHDSFDIHQFDRVEAITEITDNSKGTVKIFRGTSLKNRRCVPFKTLRGETPLCIFDPEEDKMISSYINDYATWEPLFLNATADILNSYPNMTFIDLGCNIGAYTVFVAKLGRRVIAVDILKESLLRLQESLLLGKIYQNVTLVHNAISDTRRFARVEVVQDNIGGSHIKDPAEKADDSGESDGVHSILLDDLLEIVPPGSVYMKMDIEGTELKALRGARKFLQLLDVKVILMEWMLHRNDKSGQEIIRIMLRNGMLPYVDHKQDLPLNLGGYTYWPDNIFWIKR